jgi:general stress protein 26
MTRSQRKTIADLLTAQKLGILATLGQAYPYQNIVAFAASGDLKNILFATKRSTSKYRNLKSRKRVAIFIDDRSNRETDFQQATGAARAVKNSPSFSCASIPRSGSSSPHPIAPCSPSRSGLIMSSCVFRMSSKSE